MQGLMPSGNTPATMTRVLYIDVPFASGVGGDKNRSRFLWRTLDSHFEVDLLLVTPDPGSHSPVPLLRLAPEPARFPDPSSVPRFTPAALGRLDALLEERRYDLVLARFLPHWHLLRQASRHGLAPAIVLDLDFIPSRLTALAWSRQRSLRRRWFLFESLKLRRLERRLLRQPWLVLLSNPAERAFLPLPASGGARLDLLPNVLPDAPAPAPPARQAPILFFGSLDSSANADALEFLLHELVPRLGPDLRRHGVRIEIVGRNPPPGTAALIAALGPVAEQIVLTGPVDSIENAIDACRFVLLPLRIASGTRTRILEAASRRRTVVTTTLGTEGIDVDTAARVADTPEGLASAVRELLEQPELALDLGRRLHARCVRTHAAEQVGARLVELLRQTPVPRPHAPRRGS